MIEAKMIGKMEVGQAIEHASPYSPTYASPSTTLKPDKTIWTPEKVTVHCSKTRHLFM